MLGSTAAAQHRWPSGKGRRTSHLEGRNFAALTEMESNECTRTSGLQCSCAVVLAAGVLFSYNVAAVETRTNQLIRIMENPANSQSEHPNDDRAADETASAQANPQPQPEKRV